MYNDVMECNHPYDNDSTNDNDNYIGDDAKETVYNDVVECDHLYYNDYIDDNVDNDDYVGDDGRGDGVRRCSGVRPLL